MYTPTNMISMIASSLFRVQPLVREMLTEWRKMAAVIPDPELRRQALMSIDAKTFHCQGGSILGLLAGSDCREAIRFIVAYQTISDYLDNLCDRSTSLDQDDFTALHEAMPVALGLQEPADNYYRLHQEQNDGGYLTNLVDTCRRSVSALPGYRLVRPALAELCQRYCELQIYKHGPLGERVPQLSRWHGQHQEGLPSMRWFEFAAATGSTLGIFALVSRAFRPGLTPDLVAGLKGAYYPWVQGLHILLDYLIDQEEDRRGGDLNFCSFYENQEELQSRFIHFYEQAVAAVRILPLPEFHLYVVKGLLGAYLADSKVSHQPDARRVGKRLLPRSGWQGAILFLNCYIYRRVRPDVCS